LRRGSFISSSPNCDRVPIRMSLHPLAKVEKSREWLNRAILDTSHKITFAPHRESGAAAAPVGSGRSVCQDCTFSAVQQTGVFLCPSKSHRCGSA
jgi:hypothetical protein